MIRFFKKNWAWIVLSIAVFVLIAIFISNLTRAFRQEVKHLKEKLELIQAGIDNRWAAVEKIDTDLGKLTEAIADIDTALEAGETRFQQLASRLGDIQDRLKIEPEPQSFEALEKCQAEYNKLYADFKLTHEAYKEKAYDFELCIKKTGILEDKIGLLKERSVEITGIAEAYKQQFETTYDTLTKLKAAYKWRAVAGSTLDVASMGLIAHLAQHGKWKQAVGTIALRYILKLLVKV